MIYKQIISRTIQIASIFFLLCIINVWSANEPLMILEHLNAPIIGPVKFSPTATKLVTVGGKTVVIWDVLSGEPLLAYEGHKPFSGGPYCVAFSSDEKYILSGGYSYTALLWNTETGETIKTYRLIEGLSPNEISAVALSPDGNFALTAAHAKIYMWDIASEKIIKEYNTGYALELEFLPGGRHFLLREAGEDKIISIEDGSTVFSFLGGKGVLSNDKMYIYSLYTDGYTPVLIRKWDVQTGELVQTSPLNEGITGTNIIVSQNGKYAFYDLEKDSQPAKLVSSENASIVRNFNAVDSTVLTAKVFSPLSDKVVGTSGNKIYIYDISDLTSRVPNADLFDN